MFIHKKELLRPVKVLDPNPRWGQIILEQYAGADSEASALNTYLTQRFNTNIPEIRDLLEDIGTEEISHWEMVAEMARQHGSVVKMRDSAGNPWSSTYTDVSGNIVTKLFIVPTWFPYSLCSTDCQYDIDKGFNVELL